MGTARPTRCEACERGLDPAESGLNCLDCGAGLHVSCAIWHGCQAHRRSRSWLWPLPALLAALFFGLAAIVNSSGPSRPAPRRPKVRLGHRESPEELRRRAVEQASSARQSAKQEQRRLVFGLVAIGGLFLGMVVLLVAVNRPRLDASYDPARVESERSAQRMLYGAVAFAGGRPEEALQREVDAVARHYAFKSPSEKHWLPDYAPWLAEDDLHRLANRCSVEELGPAWLRAVADESPGRGQRRECLRRIARVLDLNVISKQLAS